MKILWLCNIVLPELSDIFQINRNFFGGWLTGLWEYLQHSGKFELVICVPITNPEKRKDGVFHAYRYYSFPAEFDSTEKSREQIERFIEILRIEKPDVIHIWGTECNHSLAMIEACQAMEMQSRAIVNIQGLVSVCGEYYCYGLPKEVITDNSCGQTIQEAADGFSKKGILESELLRKVQYAIGRTDWDRYWTKRINPEITYFECGEILRGSFYSGEKWSFTACDRHSIFISQSDYPIKGVHTIVKQLAQLSRKYEDLKINIAGRVVSEKGNGYHRYLLGLLKENGLEKKVSFIGKLTAEEMYRQYLKANVFLSASIMENSSNSLCEAIRIGTPVVASYVGGTGSIISHGISGYLYPLEECDMMEYYVERIFDDSVLAERLSEQERNRSEEYNNPKKISGIMEKIYETVGKA